MHTPALNQIEAYWDGLRDGRLLPARVEVDPRGISHALDHAFILERIAAGVARFRLAGSPLSDLMGMEVRGMPLSALIVAQERARIADAVEQVVRGPCIARLSLSAPAAAERGELHGALLLCPLLSDLGDVSRLLGALEISGSIGRQPRRLAISGVQLRKLIPGGTRAVLETVKPPAFVDDPLHKVDNPTAQGWQIQARSPATDGFNEDRPVFKGKPKLRLVKDSDETG